MNALYPKHPHSVIVDVIHLSAPELKTGVQIEKYPDGKLRGLLIFAGRMCFTEQLHAFGAQAFTDHGRRFVRREQLRLAQ